MRKSIETKSIWDWKSLRKRFMMSRRIAAGALAGLMAVGSLTGCGSGGDSSSGEKQTYTMWLGKGIIKV